MIPINSFPGRTHNDSLHRLRQHEEDNDELLDFGRPVVWRWVPDVVDNEKQNDAVDGIASSSTTKQPPRIIHATAQETKNSMITFRLPHSFTGGTRESQYRKHLFSSASSSPLLIPEVPTALPAHVNLVYPSMINPIRNSLPLTTKATASKISANAMEAAALLLNMGGTNGKKKRNTKISDGRNHSSSSTTSIARSPAIAVTTSPLEDKYLDDWVTGTVSLHTAEDEDVLSPLHCFMRKYCVEAFSATPEDVATPRYGKSHGFKVSEGQVGIRCLHCKDLSPNARAERSVCYPSSLRNIYHSIETWQRRHSLVCKRITPWVKKSIVELMESSKTKAGGRRQYWEDSARRLGMVDTSQGVRFARTPGRFGPIDTSDVNGKETGNTNTQIDHEPRQVVRPEDKDLVTDYLFLLMEQMQTCRFTEEDRTGGRSKIKNNQVGFPGMECLHCQGRAGFGRYFPSSVSALSLANSDRNVYNHLQKCRKCPESVKIELNRLQQDQNQFKNRRGLRKLFFNRIWSRMHDEEVDNETKNNQGTRELTIPMDSTSSVPSAMIPFSSDRMHSYFQTIGQM